MSKLASDQIVKERLILTQCNNFIVIQNEFCYADVEKDIMSLFHILGALKKKLSKKDKLAYVLKHLEQYIEEPVSEDQYEEDVWDDEIKNNFARNLIERLKTEK